MAGGSGVYLPPPAHPALEDSPSLPTSPPTGPGPKYSPPGPTWWWPDRRGHDEVTSQRDVDGGWMRGCGAGVPLVTKPCTLPAAAAVASRRCVRQSMALWHPTNVKQRTTCHHRPMLSPDRRGGGRNELLRPRRDGAVSIANKCRSPASDVSVPPKWAARAAT